MWSSHSATCEVCKRLDYDLMPKPAKFCYLCQAWICETCYGSPGRRIRAALQPLELRA